MFLACFLSVVVICCTYIKYKREIYQYLIEIISDYRAEKTTAETSVLMPTYNRLDLLPKAIDSILNQTYKNFEFIILDDGSDIKNWDLLFDYLKKDNRIRVYFNKENKGRAYTRNKLFGLAKGKYLLDVRMHSTNPEEYYKQQRENFYEVKKRFQTMFLGNDEKLHAASLCERLKILKEWNKKNCNV